MIAVSTEYRKRGNAYEKLLERLEGVFPYSIPFPRPQGLPSKIERLGFSEKDLKKLVDLDYLDLYQSGGQVRTGRGVRDRRTNSYRLGMRGFITLTELRAKRQLDYRFKITLVVSLLALTLSVINMYLRHKG